MQPLRIIDLSCPQCARWHETLDLDSSDMQTRYDAIQKSWTQHELEHRQGLHGETRVVPYVRSRLSPLAR
jgi:glutaredoxin